MDAGRELGAAMVGLCIVLDPQAVIVGGHLGRDGSPLVDGIRSP